ncbi:hypothetical protein CRN76_17115 [Chryseobacterium indologenes]|uniref:hypothetical protein n=1 Tax=Chryseobacterium indologenes TaxID=253 RepID=UPI000B51DAC5|nr:hypothetical protein [Chryseobacterium indologenes]ASE63097.1 hypothetical protein CEQ15_17170 [Chryseobacterium indologenes]ATN07005.1 hypothetical protein CRN76_17115 [Chryseobacterium indologenes]AYY84249.1 hypothetical protein EGX91_06680 [Chryseobacterium indologenes]QIX81199.1 hypothetical protein FOB56_08125 [Chryseobacterium indologenes]TLX25812.1 hypothetical protein FE904_09250 [Chryseobacterium indologenes]
MENDYLLSLRLRSLRSRKRTKRKDVEKQIRKKFKRSEELWKIKRNTPPIPLDSPYQRGFVRFFVVRDDVMRSKDGEFFEEILRKINTWMYSESRQFLKKKRKFGRRIYVEKEQKLKTISSWSWNDPKLGLTARERQYFLKYEEYCPYRKCNEVYYEFTEPWRFTLRIRPNMITHYKPVDFEMEKEIAELEACLQQHKTVGIIHKKIYGKSYRWRSQKEDVHLIRSGKYFTCALSAKEIAECFQDV